MVSEEEGGDLHGEKDKVQTVNYHMDGGGVLVTGV